MADQWEEGFGRLLDYVERHGDARVPQSYTVDGYKLGQWVNAQRPEAAKAPSTPTANDDSRTWPAGRGIPFADRWEEGFRRLLDYVERHGDARVPQSYKLMATRSVSG